MAASAHCAVIVPMTQRPVWKWAGWAAVLALALLLQPLSDRVEYERLVHGLSRPMPATRLVERDFMVVPGVVAGAILGGFREIAAAMLWMKADEMWNKGEGTTLKFLSLQRTTTLLDPHWIEPWRMTGWHLTYNMFVETDDPERKAMFLQMGLDCLKEGIAWNPHRYELYQELGWIYYDKVRDYDEAAKWLGQALNYEHPEFIERVIAHAYERKPDMERALDWYDFCLKRNPADNTAHGATLTIRQRYLRAYRLAAEGKYDEALQEVNYFLAVKPQDPLPLHMKAYVLEKAGRLKDAYDVWMLVGTSQALNAYARARAAEIGRKIGIEAPAEATDILKQRSKAPMAVPQRGRG